MRCFDITPVLIPVAVLVFLMALHTEVSFSPFRITFHNWRMVGKLTKQNMEKLQASKPHDEKNSEDSPLRKLRDAIKK